jgi:hypothetical protein
LNKVHFNKIGAGFLSVFPRHLADFKNTIDRDFDEQMECYAGKYGGKNY